jgi:hypothetical protein
MSDLVKATSDLADQVASTAPDIEVTRSDDGVGNVVIVDSDASPMRRTRR